MDQLRPLDQAPYFDVVETILTATGNIDTVAVADPARVALLLAVAATADSWNVGFAATLAQQSTRIVTSNSPWEIYQSLSGPLCVQQFRGHAAIGTRLHVIEVFLRRFPGRNLEGLSP